MCLLLSADGVSVGPPTRPPGRVGRHPYREGALEHCLDEGQPETHPGVAASSRVPRLKTLTRPG